MKTQVKDTKVSANPNHGKKQSKRSGKNNKKKDGKKEKSEGKMRRTHGSLNERAEWLVKQHKQNAEAIEVLKHAFEMMKACLKSTNQWPRLQNLEGDDLDDEAQTCVDACGKLMCSEMNTIRGQHQSNLQKVWTETRETM